VPSETRYSLWLVPEGAVDGDLQAVVDRLAREHGGPTFPPHVTLFGGIVGPEDDVVARSRELAARVAPFTVHLDDVDAGETYFQSLFAIASPTPDLLATREAAQLVFPDVTAEPYRPHLSLLYGDLPAEAKRAILVGLRGTLPPSFEARTLVLVRTGGFVADWQYPLRAPFSRRPG